MANTLTIPSVYSTSNPVSRAKYSSTDQAPCRGYCRAKSQEGSPRLGSGWAGVGNASEMLIPCGLAEERMSFKIDCNRCDAAKQFRQLNEASRMRIMAPRCRLRTDHRPRTSDHGPPPDKDNSFYER